MTPPTVEEALAYGITLEKTLAFAVRLKTEGTRPLTPNEVRLVLLAEEVARLRADAARLDWMEEHACYVVPLADVPGEAEIGFRIEPDDSAPVDAGSLRVAIDAARRSA